MQNPPKKYTTRKIYNDGKKIDKKRFILGPNILDNKGKVTGITLVPYERGVNPQTNQNGYYLQLEHGWQFFPQLFGTRAQVFLGMAYKTKAEKFQDDFTRNNAKHIVSKSKRIHELKNMPLLKCGYGFTLGKFVPGGVPIDQTVTKKIQHKFGKCVSNSYRLPRHDDTYTMTLDDFNYLKERHYVFDDSGYNKSNPSDLEFKQPDNEYYQKRVKNQYKTKKQRKVGKDERDRNRIENIKKKNEVLQQKRIAREQKRIAQEQKRIANQTKKGTNVQEPPEDPEALERWYEEGRVEYDPNNAIEQERRQQEENDRQIATAAALQELAAPKTAAQNPAAQELAAQELAAPEPGAQELAADRPLEDIIDDIDMENGPTEKDILKVQQEQKKKKKTNEGPKKKKKTPAEAIEGRMTRSQSKLLREQQQQGGTRTRSPLYQKTKKNKKDMVRSYYYH